MVEYTIRAESLDEVAEELESLGIARRPDGDWTAVVEALERVLEGVRVAHENTDGAGNQQRVIAEYAGLDDEFSSHEVGHLLDALRAFDYVEQDGRLYRLGTDGPDRD